MKNMSDHINQLGVVILVLYMVMALCCSWLVLVFSVFALVFACFGRYSWKAILLVAVWSACGFSCAFLHSVEGVLFSIAASPAIGWGMWRLEHQRMKSTNAVLSH